MSRTTWDTFKRYGWLSIDELKGIAVVVLVFAFILSFRQWGDEQFNFAVGMANFIGAVIVVSAGIAVHELGQRFAATRVGFKTELKVWWYGLIVCLLVGILTRGKVMIFAATGMWIHHLGIHRLGYFRYGPNTKAFGLIALSGPALNIITAGVVAIMQNMNIIQRSGLIDNFIFFSIAFALYSLLPIPPLDGSRLLFYSRLTYAFIIGAFAGFFFLYLAGLVGLYTYFISLVIGVTVWFVYYLKFEK